MFVQSGKRPFHYPAPRQNDETSDIIALFDNFQSPVSKLIDPFNQLAGITCRS